MSVYFVFVCILLPETLGPVTYARHMIVVTYIQPPILLNPISTLERPPPPMVLIGHCPQRRRRPFQKVTYSYLSFGHLHLISHRLPRDRNT